MSTKTSRWALGSISTSLVTSLAAALWLIALLPALAADSRAEAGRGEGPRRSPLLRELTLAREKGLYLVLRPGEKILEIRARGMVLDTVPLLEAAVLSYRPWLGGGARPGAGAAALPPPSWTVSEDPEGQHRLLVAPPELRPLPKEGEEEEDDSEVPAPASVSATVPGGAAGTLEALPEPPDTYTLKLSIDEGDDEGGDEGAGEGGQPWRLLVTREVPRPGLLGRFGQAFAAGWTRLRGQAPETPNLLVLAVSPEEGRRLHHLFRLGTVIVLAAGTDPEPAPN